MEKAERAYDLNKVAELRHGKIPQLEAELKKLEKPGKATTLFKEEVSGRRRSPRSSRSGRASRSPGSSRATSKSSCGWRTPCTSGSSARTRP
jgi:hypothetical protein